MTSSISLYTNAEVHAAEDTDRAPLEAQLDSTQAGPDRSIQASFVGRERELEQLQTGFAASVAGLGQVFLLVGESGVGKTRLADVASQHAEEQGGLVVWGRCWEGGGAPVYWPWIQVIRSLLAERGLASRALTPKLAAQIGHVVPEIKDLFPEESGIASDTSGDGRFEVFSAVTTFLRRAAAERPLVFVFDDLHAADTTSLLLLRFVARELRGSRLLVIGAYRDVEARLSPDVSEPLGAIAREGRTIHLQGLQEHDVAAFISKVSGRSVANELVARVHDATGGNPFFVDEAVRLLVGDHRSDDQGDDILVRLPLSDGIRHAVGVRLGPLSDECRRFLSLAAVLGREFTFATLRQVTDAPADQLLQWLHEAVDRSVLVELTSAFGRYAFAHELIRHSIYEELGPERARLHRQIGVALDELYGDNTDDHVAQLAHHFFEGAHLGDADKAVSYCRAAGERAMRLFAYDEAADRFERALVVMDVTNAEATERCEVLLALGAAQMRAGQSSRSRKSFKEAATIAKRIGAPDVLGQAALLYGDWASQTWAPDESLIALLHDALDAVPEDDGALHARLLATLAEALRWSNCPERVHALANRAVEMARRMQDGAALAFALQGLQATMFYPDHVQEITEIVRERISLAEAGGNVELALLARHDLLACLLTTGDRLEANREIETFARQSAELRQPLFSWMSTMLRAGQHLLTGEVERGQQLLMEALALAHRLQGPMALTKVAPMLSLLSFETARDDEFLPVIEELYDRFQGAPIARCQYAQLHARRGDEAKARRELELLATDDFGALPRDSTWLSCVALLAQVAATLRDAPRARLLYEHLLPYQHLHVMVAGVYYGPVSYYLGLLAHALGDSEAAEAHLESARRSCATAPLWEARTHYEQATHGQVKPSNDAAVLRKEGDYWFVEYAGRSARLKDSKGFRYLAYLVRNPNAEIHVLDVVANAAGSIQAATPVGAVADELQVRGDLGDAGAILDGKAKQAYKARLSELREDLEEAEAFGDIERVARAKEEIDFLAHELSSAVGLGGRDRRAASPAERARVSVTKAIKACMTKIASHNEPLGDHLSKTIKTGYFCSYTVSSPDVRWKL